MSTTVLKVSVPAAVPTPRAARWLGAVLDAVSAARLARRPAAPRGVGNAPPLAARHLLDLASQLQTERPELAAELRLVARHRPEAPVDAARSLASHPPA